VTPQTDIDPETFVSAVQPLLKANDLAKLLAFLRENWTAEQIVSLLSSPCCDARKVAALSLALVGGKCCVDPLVKRLADGDRVVNEMAEHALWSIWFRSSTCEANHQLARGSQALERRDFDHAVHHFNRAIEIDPNFAEAYNQRGIAMFLQEKYEESIVDCQHAIDRLPTHFGAWAGMGHSYAHLGRLKEAKQAYERALEINPHLDCVREMVSELCRKC
jgi:tetratricopeptide (TPR) repeat protein